MVFIQLFSPAVVAIGSRSMNECGYVPIKLHLWTLKFKFLIALVSQSIIFLLTSFSHLKMKNPFLVHKSYKKIRQAEFGLQAVVC